MSKKETTVRITERIVVETARALDIADDRAAELWRRLAETGSAPVGPRFDLTHVLWYAGALIVMAAMGWFTTTAWNSFGGQALVLIAAIYAATAIKFGRDLWKADLRVPGGLLIAVAVSMAPLAVFGFQEWFGWWIHGDPGSYRDFFRWIRGGWLPMEVATVLAGIVALRFYRFPFIVLPIAVALWFASMDLTQWVLERETFSWEERQWISLWFGLAILACAWVVDHRAEGGFAFWLHLAGLAAFWGGLSTMYSDSELAKAIYCLINVVLVGLSVFLSRRAYAVFGAMGVAGYLGHLAFQVFDNSFLFPFALSMVGAAIIYAGILYHRYRPKLATWLDHSLPVPLDRLRPAHARVHEGGAS